jgi:hypothetical protein
VESSGDSTQKIGLETNSGDFYPALARTACAEPLRPFKKSTSAPSRPLLAPETDYHLVRLGTNPIGSAAYLPLRSRLSPARCLCLISLARALSLLGRTRGRKPGKSFRRIPYWAWVSSGPDALPDSDARSSAESRCASGSGLQPARYRYISPNSRA